MKLAMSLFLAVLAIPMMPAVQQVKPQRDVKYASDGDDDGVLPYSMLTPYGSATVYVHPSGMSALVLNGVFFAVGPLDSLPLLPGMIEAHVTGGMCALVTDTDPETGAYVSFFKPVTGHGGSIDSAVANLHAQVEALGHDAVPCESGQG